MLLSDQIETVLFKKLLKFVNKKIILKHNTERIFNMELIYSIKELEDVIKNIDGVKFDINRVKIETNFCFSTENKAPKIILDLDYNYTHRGERYYKITPKIYDSFCYYGHSTKITWPDSTTSQITWPDSSSCTDLYDYFNKLKTIAENVSKRRTLSLKKRKVKEKIF